MKKDKFKIQVGDTLYEASKMYKKVIEWKIKEIFFEHYVSDVKTITCAVSDVYGSKCFFASDIIAMYDTKEEAQKALASM